MATIKETYSKIEAWFGELPCWQQDAAYRMLSKGYLDSGDIDSLYRMCLEEAAGKKPSFHILPPGSLSGVNDAPAFVISSISEVKGVNALKQNKPLELSGGGIVVVYGKNGSGKSGYSRILKKVSGDQDVLIHPNIYETEHIKPTCQIEIKQQDSREIIFCDLSSQDFDPRFSRIDVFDSQMEKSYLDGGKEPAYLPEVFPLLLGIVDACGKIKTKLDQATCDLSQSYLPGLPGELAESDIAAKVASISWESDANQYCADWGQVESAALEAAEKYVKTESPEARIELKKIHLDTFGRVLLDLEGIENVYSSAQTQKLNESISKIDSLEKAGNDFSLVLEGDDSVRIGVREWRALWDAAKEYSSLILYPGSNFPRVDPGDRCPLCLQKIGDDGARNLTEMDAYVKSTIAKNADLVRKEVEGGLSAYPSKEKLDNIKRTIDSVEMVDVSCARAIRGLLDACVEETDHALKRDLAHKYKSIDFSDAFFRISGVRGRIQDELRELAELSNPEAIAAARQRVIALKSRRFLNENGTNFEKEIIRLKKLHTLDTAKKLVRTNRISTKVNQLSQELIAKKYISDFRAEVLRATKGKLQVELVKQSPKKGRIPYAVKLRAASEESLDPSPILSEGEKRVISLAAFLADTKRSGSNCPLVFDDPITSLDEDFELTMLKRLVEEGKTRQIIVFTHRISTVVSIEEISRTVSCPYMIRQIDEWPTGCYKGMPIEPNNGKKPDKILNSLQESLADLKKAEEAGDIRQCNELSSYICTHIRKSIESCVEYVLLNEVVLRFRRSIVTRDKLDTLAKISLDDCKFLDSMMTKYSFDEHLAPQDSPRKRRSYGELMEDREDILEWIGSFKKRPFSIA